MGKTLIIIGIICILAGLALEYLPKFPYGLGKLPGDVSIERENFKFYFPLASSIVVSLLLSLILWLVRKYF